MKVRTLVHNVALSTIIVGVVVFGLELNNNSTEIAPAQKEDSSLNHSVYDLTMKKSKTELKSTEVTEKIHITKKEYKSEAKESYEKLNKVVPLTTYSNSLFNIENQYVGTNEFEYVETLKIWGNLTDSGFNVEFSNTKDSFNLKNDFKFDYLVRFDKELLEIITKEKAAQKSEIENEPVILRNVKVHMDLTDRVIKIKADSTIALKEDNINK